MPFSEREREIMRQEGKTESEIDEIDKAFDDAERAPCHDMRDWTDDQIFHFFDKMSDGTIQPTREECVEIRRLNRGQIA